MADNILDRDKHPEWNGERTKMVYSFPANEKLWQQYAQLRADSPRRGNAGEEATAFYRANRDAMDAGAAVAWPERFNHDELSAIQHGQPPRQVPAHEGFTSSPRPSRSGTSAALFAVVQCRRR
jgi:hypothetical protein